VEGVGPVRAAGSWRTCRPGRRPAAPQPRSVDARPECPGRFRAREVRQRPAQGPGRQRANHPRRGRPQQRHRRAGLVGQRRCPLRHRCSSSAAAEPGRNSPPPYRRAIGNSANSSSVTTPKPRRHRAAPEQLRGAVGVDLVRSPVRGDQPQPVHVVRGEAVAAAERAHPPAEGVAGDAHRRRRRAQRRQTVRRGRRHDLGPGGPGAHADRRRRDPRRPGLSAEPPGYGAGPGLTLTLCR
jgi:hypothetical protein